MKKKKNIDLNKIANKIRDKFGKSSMMILGKNSGANIFIDSISTGSKALNKILEIGGIPRGRIIEIYGNESSGKTTLTLHIIANVQKAGGVAAFIDAEHCLDPKYAEKIGVDLSKVMINQPDYGEQGLNIAEEILKTKKVDVLIIDSVAALVPKAELDGDMEKNHMGLQARMMGQHLRKISHIVKESNTAVIFINQVREKIGVMFGERTTTPGGRALKFWSVLRLHLTKIKTIKKGQNKIANLIKVVVKKSKVSIPFKEAEFFIVYGVGIKDKKEK